MTNMYFSVFVELFVEWIILSDKVINIDFMELDLTKKSTELVKHLLKKERKRERRKLKRTKKKKKNNYMKDF